MAKKSTTRRKAAAKKTARRTKTSRSLASARKRPAARKVARRKSAARAAATRSARRKPAPKVSRLESAASTVRGAVAGAVGAVTRRLPWSSGEDDALSLLEKDHRRFEQLLKRAAETTEYAVQGRIELLRMITAELSLHELIEEKILYPALRLHPEANDIVLESFQEHHVADVIVGELQRLDVSDEQWGAKFKVFKENLEHHIQEEEGQMWRTARGVFSQDELRQLGSRMARMKADERKRSQPPHR